MKGHERRESYIEKLERIRAWTLTSIAQPDPVPFASNLRGMLTEAQIKEFRALERPLTPEEIEMCDQTIRGLSISGVLLVTVGAVICSLSMWWTINSEETVIIFFILLLFLSIPFLLIHRSEMKDSFEQRRKKGDSEAQEYCDAYAPLTLREDIQQVSGSISLSERTSSSQPYTVEIGGKRFNISEELWNWLRRRNGVFIANTLTTPYHGEVLLSIQRDDYVPPDESRLEQVMGVGVDGELIYADDPAYQQTSPHTRPLGQDETHIS